MSEALKFIGIFVVILGIDFVTIGCVAQLADVPIREIPFGKTIFKPVPGDMVRIGLIAACISAGILTLRLMALFYNH